MAEEHQTHSEKLANNAMLAVVSRFAMIAATVALPLSVGGIGWLLNRNITAQDEISKKVDSIKDQSFETNTNVKLIQQILTIQGTMLADHEARVRMLENFHRSTTTVPH